MKTIGEPIRWTEDQDRRLIELAVGWVAFYGAQGT
jgi:hypothetical protein